MNSSSFRKLSFDSFKKNVLINPQKIYIEKGNQQLTLEDFFFRVQVIMHSLQKKLPNGGRVALVLNDPIEMIVSIYSIVWSGMTYIPISQEEPSYRLNKIMECALPDLIITNEKISNFNLTNFKELLSFQKNKKNYECEIVDSPSSIYIIFTSGSSGEPKGVEISDSNLLHFFLGFLNSIEHLKEERILNINKFNFDMSVLNIFLPCFTNSTLILPDSLIEYIYPGSIIKNKNISFLFIVPRVTAQLVQTEEIGVNSYPSLRNVIFAGDVLGPDIVELWRQTSTQLNIYNTYGPTETTIICTYFKIPTNYKLGNLVPIGIPFYNTTVIINKNSDDIGEIVLGGPLVSDKGYLNYQNDNFKNNLNQRIYFSGDLGHLGDDGLLHISGRIDRQVKVRGFRIDLLEIEYFTNLDSKIIESYALPNIEKDVIYLFISIKKDSKLMIDSVIANLMLRLSENIPNYMLPTKIINLDMLPKNNNCKIDVNKLVKIIEQTSN